MPDLEIHSATKQTVRELLEKLKAAAPTSSTYIVGTLYGRTFGYAHYLLYQCDRSISSPDRASLTHNLDAQKAWLDRQIELCQSYLEKGE